VSPDGKWVLGENPPGKPVGLFLLPTGPGKARTLPGGGFTGYNWGAWLPDGKSVVYSAVAASGNSRVYLQAVPDGKPQPIGPDEVIMMSALSPSPVSPDGKYAVATRNHTGEVFLIPLDGSQPRVLPGLSPATHRIAQWSPDARHLYVYRAGERPLNVQLYDLETGQSRPWKQIPFDDSIETLRFRITPDGRAWAYGGPRNLAALYLVEGLH
jgi:Tol biopolymer transport system component